MIQRFRLSIASLFSIGLGVILLISVGTVLAISTIGARQMLVGTIAEEFDLTISTIDERVKEHLEAPKLQVAYLADLYVRHLDMRTDNDRLAFAIKTSLAATPQVTAIAFVRPDGTSVRLERAEQRALVNDLANRTDIAAVVSDMEALGPDGVRNGWSEPFFSPNIGRSIIVRRQSVWIGGRFEGVFFAAVDLIALSRYAHDVSASIGQTVFILHGRESVIAHPNLINGSFELSKERPMAHIGDLGDRRLEQIWRADSRPVISQDVMQRSEGHYYYDDGDWHVFVYADVDRYGAMPWLLGYHFDTSSQGSEVRRFWEVLALSVGVLLAFILLGGWIGHVIARPFRLLTDNATSIRNLDFDTVTPLHGSRITELDRAAKAFDAMIAGLRVFERYVPKRLVEQILREGQHSIEADERAITILFADIAGFTQLAEAMTPQETAALLNHHFACVGECIDAQNGTIDKYVGDGLLAFWGAPEQQPDHADRACLAALAIRQSLAEENEKRRASGQPPIQVRIGINTGPAIVGDIGAENRINYTAIGDAVNIAARVEAEGRKHSSGDVTVLVTENTVRAAQRRFTLDQIGPTMLRGRSQPIALFRLVDAG